MCITESLAIYLKLPQHYKSTILQLKPTPHPQFLSSCLVPTFINESTVCTFSCFCGVPLIVIPGAVAHRLLVHEDFPGKNAGVGCQFLLQRIFPTQGLNLFPALQAGSLPLSHQGSLSSAMNLSLFPWNRRWM